MIMIAAVSLFTVLAVRGYPWITLVLAIPMVATAGLLDTPPDFARTNVFLSDVAKVLTKAVVLSVFCFAVGRLAARIRQRRLKQT